MIGTYPTVMIERLEKENYYLRRLLERHEIKYDLPLDKSEKEVRNKVEVLVEGEGPMGDYGDV